MATRPLVVAFDVLETLLDLRPLHDRFAEIGLATHLLQPWFLRFQRDCMALALSGSPWWQSTPRTVMAPCRPAGAHGSKGSTGMCSRRRV